MSALFYHRGVTHSVGTHPGMDSKCRAKIIKRFKMFKVQKFKRLAPQGLRRDAESDLTGESLVGNRRFKGLQFKVLSVGVSR